MALPIPPTLQVRAKRPGFSLVETLIALGVFSVVSLGLLAGIIQVRRIAEGNVHQSTALTVATGFIEQIKSMEYNDLSNLSEGQSIAFVVDQTSEAQSVPLGQFSELQIPVDSDKSGKTCVWMPFQVKPQVKNLASTSDKLPALQLDLTFRWRSPNTKSWIESKITTIRSSVPSY